MLIEVFSNKGKAGFLIEKAFINPERVVAVLLCKELTTGKYLLRFELDSGTHVDSDAFDTEEEALKFLRSLNL